MLTNLPSLYGITAVSLFPDLATFLQRLDHALEKQSLRLLQVRDKQLVAAQREQLAYECVVRSHAHGCRVLVNDDAKLASKVGAAGVHLSSSNLANTQRSSLPGLVGVSCHNATELNTGLHDLGADFAVLSPVFPTRSHARSKPLGWERFASLVSKQTRPVYALGGLQQQDLSRAQSAGAIGLASMRSVWGLSPLPHQK